MATWTIYDQFRLRQENGNAIDLDNPGGNGLKIMLTDNVYVPSQQNDVFVNPAIDDGVTDDEVSGSNYTAGGNAVGTPSLTGPTAGGLITFDGADPATWLQHATGFTNARYAVLYQDTGIKTTAPLIAYANFGADKGNVSGDFAVQLDAAGIFTKPR